MKTPYSIKTKECHTNIVKNIVQKLSNIIELTKTHIIITSTVPAGTSNECDAHFMPEYLR